jgi:hypothetical protein
MSTDHETSPSFRSSHDVLRDMWVSRRGDAESEVESLCSTLESLLLDSADDDTRSRAQHKAHRLAGVFGFFGFAEPLASMERIEVGLADSENPVEPLLFSARETLSSLP